MTHDIDILSTKFARYLRFIPPQFILRNGDKKSWQVILILSHSLLIQHISDATEVDLNELTSSISDIALLDNNDEAFELAAEKALRGPPVQPSGPTSRGNRAWVVFNGHKLGVFETW